MNIDLEWENFLNNAQTETHTYCTKSNNCSHGIMNQGDDINAINNNTINNNTTNDNDPINDNIIGVNNNNGDNMNNVITTNNNENCDIVHESRYNRDSTNCTDNTPKCSDIYISTKTKIVYLNQALDLDYLFWKLQIIPYGTMTEGIVKKQMKFISNTPEGLKQITDRLLDYDFHHTHIITQIDNPIGNIKFKDVRKITVGLSKKDILNNRCKQKSVFYNCFVIIIRIKDDNKYKEIHVKIFNTGKLEIPGIQNESLLDNVLQILIASLQPYLKNTLTHSGKYETVLINSNFNCGYSIDRHKLYMILREKYKIQTMYDPCSYPGIQCKFYYNPKLSSQTGQQEHNYTKDDIVVSFMIFRTGSVLIVGKCEDNVLYTIYDFLKNILMSEYKNIYQECSDLLEPKRTKRKKIRKRTINII